MDIRYLDSETTGLDPTRDEVLELAILDEAGRVLLHTLVRPVRVQEWEDTYHIHGILPATVLRDDVPTLAELAPVLAPLLAGCELRVFNAEFDTGFLADALREAPPARVVCLMLEFAQVYGETSGDGDGYRWQKLETAAAYVLHEWVGRAHSALADAFAARAVGRYLFDPAERAAVDAEHARRRELRRAEREAQREADEVDHTLLVWEQRMERARFERNQAFTRWAFPHILDSGWGIGGWRTQARASAEVLCPHATGYPLAEWLSYSPEQLALPRFGHPGRRSRAGLPSLPEHLAHTEAGPGGVYFLHRPPAVVGMFQRRGGADPELVPVYSLDGLVPGRDFVPLVQKWPAGYCSMTALKRTHRLPADVLKTQRPALAKYMQKGGLCLLYPEPAAAIASAA